MKKYRIKKLFNNKASIRSNVVKECVHKEEPICVEYDRKSMVLTPQQLRNYTTDGKTYTSRWGSESYKLLDYDWKPTEQLSLV